MSPDNLHKYIYFLVLMLLIVGYGLLSGLYLKFKFTKLFYIRMSILSYLFYVLSDNLLYTLVFTIFILISVNVYHKNSLVERFQENLKDKSKNKDSIELRDKNELETNHNEKEDKNLDKKQSQPERGENKYSIKRDYKDKGGLKGNITNSIDLSN